MDAYQILGLNAGASKVKIKAAYKKLAHKYHPDRNSSPAAEELFKLIKEAYEFLTKQESSSGRFGVAEEYKPPPRPPTPTHVQRVELQLSFSEAFAGCRANLRISGLGMPFFANVPPGAVHGSTERLLAYNNYGQQVWVDCCYQLFDPRGFYVIKNFYGEDALYCRVKMSAAELIAERPIEVPNIDPHGGPMIEVTIPCTKDFDQDKAIKIKGFGLRNKSLRRGPLYVQPLIYFQPLEKEIYPTLVRLKNRASSLTNSYKHVIK